MLGVAGKFAVSGDDDNDDDMLRSQLVLTVSNEEPKFVGLVWRSVCIHREMNRVNCVC